MNRSVFLAMVLLVFPFSGHAQPVAHSPVPGGVAVIALPEDAVASSVRYNGKRVMTSREADSQLAIIGLSLGAEPVSYTHLTLPTTKALWRWGGGGGEG